MSVATISKFHVAIVRSGEDSFAMYDCREKKWKYEFKVGADDTYLTMGTNQIAFAVFDGLDPTANELYDGQTYGSSVEAFRVSIKAAAIDNSETEIRAMSLLDISNEDLEAVICRIYDDRKELLEYAESAIKKPTLH